MSGGKRRIRVGPGVAARSVATFLLCVLVAANVLSCRAASPEGAAKKLLQRWRLAYNSHDLATFTELYAEAGFYRPPPMVWPARSRGELRQRFEQHWRLLPDATISAPRRLVAAGGRVAFLWDLTFTDPRKGSKARLTGATFMRLDNNLIGQEITIFRRTDPVAGQGRP